MKVSDLIEKLKELDQDKYIVIGGYEGGADWPTHFGKVHIIPDQNTQWYYGKHEVEYDNPDWNAYMLGNID